MSTRIVDDLQRRRPTLYDGLDVVRSVFERYYVINNPSARLELFPQQIDLVVDKHQRVPPEHLIPDNASPEVHRVLELVFVIVRPFIEAVEWSDKEDGVEAFEERCPSQFLEKDAIQNQGRCDSRNEVLPSNVLSRKST